MSFLSRQGFTSSKQLGAFLTVVFSGQIIYSAFESFKIPFYQRLVEYYGLSDTQFGFLFTMLGVAVFFYIPGGWINNRFHVRQVLMWGLIYRCITALIMIIFRPAYGVMLAITFTWGILDAIYWPAVVKGVVLFSGRDNKGLGFGILTAFRAGGEAILNGVVIAVVAITAGSALAFETMMVLYALLAIPMAILVYFYVPKDPLTEGEFTDDQDVVAPTGKEALAGLIATLKHPRIWLAGIAGMCVYWVYSTLVYTTPFFERVYLMDNSTAATYATVNALVLGLGGGLAGGYIADYLFKSSTLTLGISLVASAVMLLTLVFIPGQPAMMWMALGAVSLGAFVIMMAKALQQAPVAELHLPTKMVGSAMSVNSFMAFAAILWALTLDGYILDTFKDSPKTGFNIIFTLMAVVAGIGALCSFWLYALNKKHNAVSETEVKTVSV